MAFLACAISAPIPAFAHPHIFAEARLDVMVGPDRIVQSLRHVWRFDEFFSSTVLLQFDRNKDMTLNAEELADVSHTIHDSLADYNYFQLVTANGSDVAMKPPPELMAYTEDGQLIVLFESKPKKPLKLEGTVDFGVYDPTFYTAIDFMKDSYLAVDTLPAGCTREVIRPDPDEAIKQNQQSLTDSFFNDPAGNDLSKIFATRLEIKCGTGR